MSILVGLNEEQKKAVTKTEGPVLIVAGAGAGKTKTITTRIAYLIINKITRGENILAITFTNKAAKEMRERALKILESENVKEIETPLILTFHSLGVYILKNQYHLLDRGKYFSIFDTDDSVSLIKDSLKESGLDPKQYEPRKFASIISKWKSKGINVSEFPNYIESSFDELVLDIWERYENKLKKEKAYDFDDLLIYPLSLLRENKIIREYYQKKFKYIHIDEYQDTNQVQYELIKLLVGEEKNICAVGDTDQNIYSWRGAQIKNMLQFEKDFPKCEVFFLEENYRSTDVILEAANNIIEKNEVRIPKTLYTKKTNGEKITIAELYNEKDEASFIVDEIIDLWDKGVRLDEIAVLYRTNFQSRILEEYLVKNHIPYKMTGTKFYDRKEIKDTVSYIKAALNRDAFTEIKRCINTPPRGIGKTTVLKIIEGKTNELKGKVLESILSFYKVLDEIKSDIETKKPSEVLKNVLDKSSIYAYYSEMKTEDGMMRKENLEELVTLAKNYDEEENGMEKFLEDISLQNEYDEVEDKEEGNKVRIMTVHQAKGLEFSYVFIVGLEEDLFPHRKDKSISKEDFEEERRLFYVALTRAKEKLFLSYATTRTIFGMRGVQTPSQFVYDIPINLIEKPKPRKPTGETIIYID
jgi:DNA helicase-2/ATP-dependent DNA helicase PcrA